MRRHPALATAASGILLAAALLNPTMSVAADQEVVRVGDREMSCTALAAEINALARPAAEQPAAKPKKRSFGFLKVLGSAVPFVGMAGGMGGAMMSSAAGAAQTVGSEAAANSAVEQTNRMMREAMAGGSPGEQRKERLTAIFEEKRC